MNISEAAAKMNVSTDTLRYYERIGLIPPVPRKANGIRDYDERFIQWIKLIQDLKELGMSLEMIMEYITLAKLGDNSLKERKALLQEVREMLHQKMMKLQERLKLADYQLHNYNEILLPKTNALMNQWSMAK